MYSETNHHHHTTGVITFAVFLGKIHKEIKKKKNQTTKAH